MTAKCSVYAIIMCILATSAFSQILAQTGMMAPPEMDGPYSVMMRKYSLKTLDSTNQNVVVYAPEKNGSYPLVSYAHGAGGGGIAIFGYNQLFTTIASHGYVVAAAMSCSVGCKDTNSSWKEYYHEQLKVIDFATATDDDVLGMVDPDAKVGIAGHSMGGLSTSNSAALGVADSYGIAAAVLHHPACVGFPCEGEAINIPLLAMTGTDQDDSCCGASTTHAVWDPAPVDQKSILVRKGADHLDPVLRTDGVLGLLTASWFKIYLEGDRGQYYEHIYGPDSGMCTRPDAVECINKL